MPELVPLRYADDDAARLFELLVASGMHGHLLTVMDEETQIMQMQWGAGAKLKLRASLGYNARWWYGGCLLSNDIYMFGGGNNAYLFNEVGGIKVFVGRRFEVNKHE